MQPLRVTWPRSHANLFHFQRHHSQNHGDASASACSMLRETKSHRQIKPSLSWRARQRLLDLLYLQEIAGFSYIFAGFVQMLCIFIALKLHDYETCSLAAVVGFSLDLVKSFWCLIICFLVACSSLCHQKTSFMNSFLHFPFFLFVFLWWCCGCCSCQLFWHFKVFLHGSGACCVCFCVCTRGVHCYCCCCGCCCWCSCCSGCSCCCCHCRGGGDRSCGSCSCCVACAICVVCGCTSTLIVSAAIFCSS